MEYSYQIFDSGGSVTSLQIITFDSATSTFRIESSDTNDASVVRIEVTASLKDAAGTQLKTLSQVFMVTFTPAVLAVAPVIELELDPVILVFGLSTTWQVPEKVANYNTSIKIKSVEFVESSDRFMSYDSQKDVITIDGEKMEERDLG